jgi:hypothetical protein
MDNCRKKLDASFNEKRGSAAKTKAHRAERAMAKRDVRQSIALALDEMRRDGVDTRK